MRHAFRYLSVAMLALAILFFWRYYSELQEYEECKVEYSAAVEKYVESPVLTEDLEFPVVQDTPPVETAPIHIDFDTLISEYPDVCGWIYCDGTDINYPIVQGSSNTQYLRRDYTGKYAIAGSIFLDSSNSRSFEDFNNIIYGHCMKNGTMFGRLSKWSEQEFYEEHKVMWLLTPDCDYKIEILSGYVTSAFSGVHTVYQEYVEGFLEDAIFNSDFVSDVEPDVTAKYILLSTCSYKFDDARYVLHGKLVPLKEG